VPLAEKPDLKTPFFDDSPPLTIPLATKNDPTLQTPLPGETLASLQNLLSGIETKTLASLLDKNDLRGPVVPKTASTLSTGNAAPMSVKTKENAASKNSTPKADKDKKVEDPKERADVPHPGGQFIHPNLLPVRLRDLPVVFFQTSERGKFTLTDSGRDDNSNSQFALLALWTARRHGVSTERVLVLAEQRYRQWQNQDGGWGYERGRASAAAMTGVGLLGLAMGHGADFDRSGADQNMTPAFTDPAIERGLKRFATFIGNPEPMNNKPAMQNLYFLWSVERVAMLYRQRAICGKDWYGWGTQSLLANQNSDGSWVSAPYPGRPDKCVDTCFALLFLRRSNLIGDLSTNINQRIAVGAMK